MHRCLVISLIICYSFFLPAGAQDSLSASDSGVTEKTIAAPDSSAGDTATAASRIDSLLQQDTDSTGQRSDTLPPVKAYSKKSAEGNGSMVKRVMKTVRNSIRKAFGYLKYFIVLAFCFGIILYTIIFYRRRKDSERFLTSTRLSVMDREVQLACKYMEENYHNSDLTIESMCEELVTGPAFLEALFEKELGMSVSEFLLQVRINRAKSILSKRSDSETDEIALDVGFTDKNLFLQKFKEITGLSFEEYRAASQNNDKIL